MEPFGLFQFLQNLLASQGNFSPDTPPITDVQNPPTEDENTEVNSEESSKNSGANSTNSKKESK